MAETSIECHTNKNNPLFQTVENLNNCETEITEKDSLLSTNSTKTLIIQKQFELKKPTVNENDEEDIEIAKIDPSSRKSIINKAAYASIHRSASLGNSTSRSVSKLKERYETVENNNITRDSPDTVNNKNEEETKNDNFSEEKSQTSDDELLNKSKVNDPKLSKADLELLKEKYSPASFGYPKITSTTADSKDTKIPLPKPRRSIKSEIHFKSSENLITPPIKAGSVEILSKDENSNLLHEKQLNDYSGSSDIEEREIILQSKPSEESIDKISKELSHFEMDKKSKRSGSFRRLFSGGLFGKDKKKKEAEKNKVKNGENIAYTDNIQNETNAFNRQSTYRHTIGSNTINDNGKDNIISNYPLWNDNKDRQYAQMHIKRFNEIRDNFDHVNEPNDNYLKMDKTQAQKKPTISDYISVPVKKYIDTSSSTTSTTTESDKVNTYENKFDSQIKNRQIDTRINESRNSTTERKSRFNDNYSDNFRQTPPRAQETYQDFKLIKPKASIPINSERPLPNPYQNNNSDKEMKSIPRTIERNLNKLEKNYPEKSNLTNSTNGPIVEDTYGTVFDSLEYTPRNGVLKPVINSQKNSVITATSPIPRSPSLEGSKLKLPPNREIYNLQPRVKSPIPSNKISAEKIIATELLKNSRSPTPPRKLNKPPQSHQEIIENRNNSDNGDTAIIKTKPPLSPKPLNYDKDSQRRTRDPATTPSDNSIVTSAVVHTPSPTKRSQTPEVELRNRSLSPIRPSSTIRSSTPSELRKITNLKLSPQKDDIRKSVEAFYWKELKKMKEQQDYELQMLQLTNGYINEPLKVRRSRSLSPSVQRVGRRSLSLPRDVKPMQTTYNPMYSENPYGRMMPPQPQQSIPEGRPLIDMTDSRVKRHLVYDPVQYPSNFIRNNPERQTFNGISKTIEENNLNEYRPIFKRGSLSKQQEPIDLQGTNKKVSFSSLRAMQSWPTKNGFTQSPPQRRPERRDNLTNDDEDDDVFLPNSPLTPQNYNKYNNNQLNYNQYGDNRLYGYSRVSAEPLYGTRTDFDPQYGKNNAIYYQQRRPESLQFSKQRRGEPLYGQRDFLVMDPQKLSYESLNIYENRLALAPRRLVENMPQNISPEEYQRFRTNSQTTLPRNNYLQSRENSQNPLYSSRQSVTDSVSGRVVPKQVSVTNRVCDIYGQIHDQSQYQKSGVILGQLQRSPSNSMTNPYNQQSTQQQNFVRGSRLTASANDMGRRYNSNDLMYIQQDLNQLVAPNRPLPPIPNGKKVPMRFAPISDTESGSDASEIQRIMNNKNAGKNKKRIFSGK